MLHQPGGIAVQLIKHFMQRIKGVMAYKARQPDGARVSDHLVIHRPVVKPRLLAVKEAHRVIRRGNGVDRPHLRAEHKPVARQTPGAGWVRLLPAFNA